MTSYSSRRTNLKPSFWGPSAWKFLYTIAIGYPVDPSSDEKNAASNLLEGLHHLLPCANCRQNVTHELKSSPYEDALSSKDKFVLYVYNLECSVAKRLGKTYVSYEKRLEQIYKGMPPRPSRATATTSTTTTTTKSGLATGYWLLIILAVLVVSIVVTWGATYGHMKHKLKISNTK